MINLPEDHVRYIIKELNIAYRDLEEEGSAGIDQMVSFLIKLSLYFSARLHGSNEEEEE